MKAKKPMKTITTKLELIHWFKGQIRSDKNKARMPAAFGDFFDHLFEEFDLNYEFHSFSNLGPIALGEYMNFVLYSFVEQVDKTTIASDMTIVFIADIFAEGLTNCGKPIPFADFARISLGVLRLDDNDLIIAAGSSGGCLSSSKKFMLKYNIKVKIPMIETKDSDEVDDDPSFYDL